ncbi:NlpC/P60 family protein [compost metagenome]
MTLPADSRQQGTWVKENSTAVTDLSGLKRGDLMFFMDYKGSSASAYAGIDKSTARITHVGIYLGDNKILHTYSVSSGGVRVDNLSASWMNRFLYGGSVVR